MNFSTHPPDFFEFNLVLELAMGRGKARQKRASIGRSIPIRYDWCGMTSR